MQYRVTTESSDSGHDSRERLASLLELIAHVQLDDGCERWQGSRIVRCCRDGTCGNIRATDPEYAVELVYERLDVHLADASPLCNRGHPGHYPAHRGMTQFRQLRGVPRNEVDQTLVALE